MERAWFISTAALEKKPFHFDTVIESGVLELPEPWNLARGVRASGCATLLHAQGMPSIRVTGRIEACALSDCDLCLRQVSHCFDREFELKFQPTAMTDEGGEASISHAETEIGFFEGDGVALPDVVREQLLLWFPVRSRCRTDCKGLCPTCGCDRNLEQCNCRPHFEDPRWEALRQLSLKR